MTLIRGVVRGLAGGLLMEVTRIFAAHRPRTLLALFFMSSFPKMPRPFMSQSEISCLYRSICASNSCAVRATIGFHKSRFGVPDVIDA